MAFKIIVVFCAFLALVNAGLLTPVTFVEKSSYPQVDAVASTHESVVRSFDGTVSTHSKSVDTPFSSVRKVDTRVNNNVYTPALAKTVTYAAPVTKTVVAHGAPTVYQKTLFAPTASTPVVYSAPAHVYTHAAPAVTKTVTYSAPAPAAHVYHHEVPSAVASSYNHHDPAVSAYGSSQTVHYSPANMVSHMSFDGFGTHWGF